MGGEIKMIDHCVYMFTIEKDVDFDIYLCECLNRYVELFGKLPNRVYTHDAYKRPKKLIGPRLKFMTTNSIENKILIGHHLDKIKIEKDGYDDGSPWGINAK